MKNIQEILAQYGLTVPEDKTADFDKVFKENYKTVAEVGKIETARDNYKSQLDEATTTLKSFEGVDVSELKGEISKLQGDLAKKESAYNAKIADMEFHSLLDGKISAANAKNVKAVKALLDVDALKKSQNRDADIQSALESVKTDNGYLFEDGKPVPTVTVPGQPAPTKPTTFFNPIFNNTASLGFQRRCNCDMRSV